MKKMYALIVVAMAAWTVLIMGSPSAKAQENCLSHYQALTKKEGSFARRATTSPIRKMKYLLLQLEKGKELDPRHQKKGQQVLKELGKILKKQDKSNFTMEDMVDALQVANRHHLFCPRGEKEIMDFTTLKSDLPAFLLRARQLTERYYLKELAKLDEGRQILKREALDYLSAPVTSPLQSDEEVAQAFESFRARQGELEREMKEMAETLKKNAPQAEALQQLQELWQKQSTSVYRHLPLQNWEKLRKQVLKNKVHLGKKMKENYLLVQLEGIHKKRNTLAKNFKTAMDSALKLETLPADLSTKITEWEEEERALNEQVKRLKATLQKLEAKDPDLAGLVKQWDQELQEFPLLEVRASLSKAKRYVDAKKEKAQIKNDSLVIEEFLSKHPVSSLANEVLKLNLEILAQETQVLNRPQGRVEWRSQRVNEREDAPLVSGYFNPRLGTIVWEMAHSGKVGFGAAYNPLTGKAVFNYDDNRLLPLIGRYNPGQGKVEWAVGNGKMGIVYSPAHGGFHKTSMAPLVGVYVPPFTRDELENLKNKIALKDQMKRYWELEHLTGELAPSIQQDLSHLQEPVELTRANTQKVGGQVHGHLLEFWQALDRAADINTFSRPSADTHRPCHEEMVAPQKSMVLEAIAELEDPSCPICFEDMSEASDPSALALLSCGHAFCRPCVENHIKSKLEGNNPHVQCPNTRCKKTLDPEATCQFLGTGDDTADTVLTSAHKKKWPLAFYRERAAHSGVLVKNACKRPDCSGMGHAIAGLPEAKCHFCASCLQCGKWHNGKYKCEEAEGIEKDNEGMRELLKSGAFRLCPHCKVPTERIQGCNKIDCKACGGRWHWNVGVFDESRYVKDQTYTWGNGEKKYQVEGEEDLFQDHDDIFQ